MDSPAVRFPPPLLFVLGYAAGWGLHRAVPWPLASGGRTLLGVTLAGLLFVLSGGLAGWAIWTFRRARTAVLPHHPAARLVTWGPYGVSRNPMYVALGLLYLSAALWRNLTWPLLLLPLVFLALWWWVVRREERYLATTFGGAYEAYRRRVRRWL
ncbi:MAG: isoprenylcysteine carboxylmethyltransferase family protein [Catalinimonas sp.]